MPCPIMFVGAILVGKPELSPVYWLIKLKDGDLNHFKENAGSFILSTTITVISWKLFKYARNKYFCSAKEIEQEEGKNTAFPA
mmetsp:Transcript_22892/g.28764  ORF Transcript_22892/g.28764 Transcript_22892/m.28764 type:complete len:83 (-) Transcript_22892:8-256(-)